jgi:hypothetical protein
MSLGSRQYMEAIRQIDKANFATPNQLTVGQWRLIPIEHLVVCIFVLVYTIMPAFGR